MKGKENRIDIDEKCKDIKALVVELAYNNPYDEEGKMLVDESAYEMELYSAINTHIEEIRLYVHKLQRDLYIQSETVKALQNNTVPEELTEMIEEE